MKIDEQNRAIGGWRVENFGRGTFESWRKEREGDEEDCECSRSGERAEAR